MKVTKYTDGTKSIFGKKQKVKEDAAATELAKIDAEDAMSAPAPKKMNFFQRLKDKEDASAAMAQSIDDADSVEATTRAKINAPTVITQEKSFVGPKQTGLDAEVSAKQSDNAKLDAVAVKSTKTPLTKGADAKLAAWQKKRGLKDDGIWGKDSEAAYKKEQASKPKKMAIKKTETPAGTTTTSAKLGSSSYGDISSDPANMKKWSKPTTTFPKQRTEQEARDAAARLEKQYGDEGGAWGADDKTANKLVAIDKKGDEEALKTMRAVGVGGTALTAASLLLTGAKNKSKGKNKLTVVKPSGSYNSRQLPASSPRTINITPSSSTTKSIGSTTQKQIGQGTVGLNQGNTSAPKALPPKSGKRKLGKTVKK